MQTVIMHLDMNSYFASVEQQDNLQWRGKPVGVCEHLGGIIIAASVEAKIWGIKTGTPVWEAKKLYPKIILTQTHPDRYRFYTRRFVNVVSDYTDKVEKYSIDEVFADITASCNIEFPISNFQFPNKFQIPNSEFQSSGLLEFYQKIQKDAISADPWEEAVKIALEIKCRFKAEVGDFLRCSVGLADNKLLAKIASDFKKPDGLVVVRGDGHVEARRGVPTKNGGNGMPRHAATEIRADDIRPYNADCVVLSKSQLYDQLELADIPGIGRRQEKNLNELGIKTLKDLRDCPKSRLVARFGAIGGYHLYNLGKLHGSWKEQVHQDEDIKSMGHMYTLPKEFRKPEFFLPVLYKLCEMVGRRLRRQNLTGNVIYFFAHDENWQGFGKSIKLGYLVQDGRGVFLECIRNCPAGVGDGFKPFPTGTKLIGITVAGLRPYANQLSLFGDAEQERRVVAALDEINDKYGEFTVSRALQIPAGKVFRDSIGFGRVKEL